MFDGQFFPGQAIQFDASSPRARPGIDFGAYHANAVNFDGANDYLTRGAGLTGVADSKLFTLVFWINWVGNDAAEVVIYNSDTPGAGTGNTFQVQRDAVNNRLRIAAASAVPATLLNLHSGAADIMDAGWTCVMISCDMADTGKRHYYFGDTDVLNVTTYTDGTIDFTVGDWSIGASPAGVAKLGPNCAVADFYFWPGVYLDFSVEANRRLFINASGKPVHPITPRAALGDPAILLHGYGTLPQDWHRNAGTGGGFTVTGALTVGASSPSD